MHTFSINDPIQAAVEQAVVDAKEELDVWKLRLPAQGERLIGILTKIQAELKDRFPDAVLSLQLDYEDEGWGLGLKCNSWDEASRIISGMLIGPSVSGLPIHLTHLEIH